MRSLLFAVALTASVLPLAHAGGSGGAGGGGGGCGCSCQCGGGGAGGGGSTKKDGRMFQMAQYSPTVLSLVGDDMWPLRPASQNVAVNTGVVMAAERPPHRPNWPRPKSSWGKVVFENNPFNMESSEFPPPGVSWPPRPSEYDALFNGLEGGFVNAERRPHRPNWPRPKG